MRAVVILMSGLHSFAFSSEVQTPNLLLPSQMGPKGMRPEQTSLGPIRPVQMRVVQSRPDRNGPYLVVLYDF